MKNGCYKKQLYNFWGIIKYLLRKFASTVELEIKKEVIHDQIFLAEKSEMATKEDLQVAQDLLNTHIVNKNGCVGMAANMIGVLV